jgi:hypothetical protein
MTFEEWWDAPKTVKQITASTKDIAQQAYAAGREAMRQECAEFVVRNAGVVPVSFWERMIKELK